MSENLLTDTRFKFQIFIHPDRRMKKKKFAPGKKSKYSVHFGPLPLQSCFSVSCETFVLVLCFLKTISAPGSTAKVHFESIWTRLDEISPFLSLLPSDVNCHFAF